MSELTIISHGESAAVVLPVAMLKAIGLHIGDVLEATVRDQQLILRPVDDVARRQLLQDITQEVFEQRQDAYQRLA